MSFQVSWSPEAEEKYVQILEYLETKWTQKEVSKFIERIDELTSLLEAFPKLFPYSSSQNTYKAVVNRQVSLIYRLKEFSSIEIVTLWDTRQDPEKNTEW
jgi:plasmid stabilization system protein ParE